MKHLCTALFVGACLAMAAPVFAETKVTLNGVHLCCAACVRGVEKVIAGVDGATVEVNAKGKTVAVTAKDDATAQKAIDALAEAGFYGKSSNDKIAIKTVTAPNGKVARLVLEGAHNCCNSCAAELKKTCKKVEGVAETAIQARTSSFVIEGNFEPNEVLQALNNAGFFVRPKQ